MRAKNRSEYIDKLTQKIQAHAVDRGPHWCRFCGSIDLKSYAPLKDTLCVTCEMWQAEGRKRNQGDKEDKWEVTDAS